MDWKNRLMRLKADGNTYGEIADILNDEFPGERFTGDRVRGWWRRNGHKTEHYDLLSHLRRGASLEDITDDAKVSERVALAMLEDLSDKGICVEEVNGVYRIAKMMHDEPVHIDRTWNGDKVLKFGVLSDTHFGSNFVQIGHLHQAYDDMKAEGIDTVYHAGDMTEGERMRPGHEYECYVHGADAHADEIMKNYPDNGITTYYILGNHDAAFVKHAGVNISRMINRKDLICLGFDSATINLTPNCTLELRHPAGGSAYAISYKPQKTIDALFGGEKPNVMVIGHYHKAEYLFYRNVHCLQGGTLQGQSGFMKRGGLAAHVGYWVVTLHVNSDGQINRFLPEWRPFYKSVKDDYKNFR